MDKETERIIDQQVKEAYDLARLKYPQYSVGDKFKNPDGKTLEILEFKGDGLIHSWSIIGCRLSSPMTKFHDIVTNGDYKKVT